ncbi:MAG: type 2 isopentenyl-diphosphate Delta-isomerase [Thermoprotei archaeon]|nr:MAG: type 2 isopentenyl-diphosphate Delta-isomerase [Thermoprotei archaeon]
MHSDTSLEPRRPEDIESRKLEHLLLTLEGGVEGPHTTWLEYVILIHNALPELSLDDVDTSIEFLKYKLSMPLIISGMTGGTSESKTVNEKIGELAQKFRVGVGVGSQRAMLLKRSSSVIETYAVVRKKAPEVPVIANIGAAQIKDLKVEELEFLVDSIGADILAIHLNPAQELVQVNGDKDLKGVEERIAEIVDRISVPVMIKEVGCGLSREVVFRLRRLGVKIFDVAGAGGTNWIAIEIIRGVKRGKVVGRELREWGIPTAAAVVEARNGAPDACIIAGGGVRTGLDIARAIALGADLVSMARPILVALMNSQADIYLRELVEVLKYAMLLTGARNIRELRRVPIVVTGPLNEWIKQRGLTIIK